ncbi:2814_t:CDS:2 [Entrophospora sp. SA101]|nr:2814_t:CDS:2 [Entrophospora sp. SA101]
MSAVSPLMLAGYFSHVNGCTEDKTAFKGADGIGFRLVSWLIFTAIIVLFNIWYCNKIYLKSSSQKKKETVKALPNKFAAKKSLKGTIQEKAPGLSSSYKAGLSKGGEATGETYEKIGTMDKEITTGEKEQKGKQQDIAKVETNVTEPF